MSSDVSPDTDKSTHTAKKRRPNKDDVKFDRRKHPRNVYLDPEWKAKTQSVRTRSQCRVCKNPDLRTAIDSLLASGATYADVFKAVEPLNDRLPKNKTISYQSIRNHQKNHLPFETDSIREILERRAAEAQQDYERGKGSIVQPLSYAEVMMKKGFTNMVERGDFVSPALGLKAALVYDKFTKDAQQSMDAAQALNSLSQILDAVKAVVPSQYWQQIVDHMQQQEDTKRLLGPNASSSASSPVAVVEEDDDDDFDPLDGADDFDEDDDF